MDSRMVIINPALPPLRDTGRRDKAGNPIMRTIHDTWILHERGSFTIPSGYDFNQASIGRILRGVLTALNGMLPHLERAALLHDYLVDPFNRPGWIETRAQVDGIFYDALMFYALRGSVPPGWYARQIIRAKAVIAWAAVRSYSIINGDN